MVIVMKSHARPVDLDHVIALAASQGYEAHAAKDDATPVVCLPKGTISADLLAQLEAQESVERVVPVKTAYKLASRAYKPGHTVVQIGPVAIGGDRMVVMAGPCAVESREQLLDTARQVKAAGADILRGGAFKPRSSPYSFQGLGEAGLQILADARQETGMPIITEVMETEQVDLVASYADILQVGSRNMQNFALLRAVGRAGRPVMLKRGMSATIEEWLLAAEYVLAQGNPSVILCERGVRTSDTTLRNILDLSAVPLLAELTHLPVIVDPSHGTGKRSLIEQVSLAAAGAGAAGIIVEAHCNPDQALCDGPQSIYPAQLARLTPTLRQISSLARAAAAERTQPMPLLAGVC